MAIPYVCGPCRERLNQQLWLKLAQYSRRSRIQSTSSRAISSAVGIRDSRPHRKSDDANGQVILGRYSRKPILRPEHVISQLSQPDQARHGERRARRLDERLSEEAYNEIRRFCQLVNQKQNERAWETLHGIKHSLTDRPGHVKALGRSAPFRAALDKLILRNVHQWNTELSTPSSASRTTVSPCESLAIFPYSDSQAIKLSSDTIWLLAKWTLEMRAKTDAESKAIHSSYSLAVSELVKVWWLVLRRRLTTEQDLDLASAGKDWSFLPSVESLRLSLSSKKPTERRYDHIFGMLLSTWSSPDKSDNPIDLTQSSMITNYILCTNKDYASTQSHLASSDLKPLLGVLQTLCEICTPPPASAAMLHMLSHVHAPTISALYKSVLSKYKVAYSLPTDGNIVLGADPASHPASHDPFMSDAVLVGQDVTSSMLADAPESPINIGTQLSRQYMVRLSRVLQTKNAAEAAVLVGDIMALPMDNSNSTLAPQVYESLMLACLITHKPTLLLEVWNEFLARGHQPTVKTFTTLMTGSRSTRDIKGLQTFWQRMIDMGIKPDVEAWSTRIFGLFRAGENDLGMSAIVEMSRAWQNRGSNPRDKVAAPDVSILNSAVFALAAQRNADHLIPKILAWARQFGIQPDIKTYNCLLNLAARQGRPDESLKLLEQMQAAGIPVDGTTWTVIITDMLSNGSLDNLSGAQLQDKIYELLESIDATAAATIDVKGYATLIDRLIKKFDNVLAAQSVLDHMSRKGVEPTAHIYTILMTAHFDAQPQPDFAAVDALLAHAQAQNRGRGVVLDDYFWDRLLEGHARHHRTGGIQRCMDVLQRMSVRQKPSWPALGSVARALIEREDANRLASLVDRVRAWDRESRINNVWHKTQSFGRRDFWKLILSTGILREEDVTSVDQLLAQTRPLSSSRTILAPQL